MKKYIAIAALALFAACGGNDKKAEEETKKDEPLAQSKNTEGLNDKFSNLLNEYYHLKDALVLTNDTIAATRANYLAASASAININEIKADPAIVETAKQYVDSILANAKQITSAKNIEAKRTVFRDLSENVYNLMITVHYDKQVVYHQFCPMAFNNEGAYWLNSDADIKNPYFGKKMLSCGEIKDSIDFRGK